MRIRLLFGLFCILSFAPPVQADENTFYIHKGVNLGAWLSPPVRQPLFLRDFVQIKNAGFDNVRIPVDPEALIANGQEPDFTSIDSAVALARNNHLSVILDMHPAAAYMKKLEENSDTRLQFSILWRAFAKHYRSIPTQDLAFGLLNEPQYYGSEAAYNDWLQTLIANIRQEDKSRYLVIDSAQGASIEGLTYLKPVSDGHIIYDFHFYEPYIITHQGYHMGFEKKSIRYFRNLPYPSQLATKDISSYAPGAPIPSKAANELDEYKQATWDQPHIAERIAKAKSWADAHKVIVICGEFGALRNHIDPESRYRWLEDTRKALESSGIGWEVWNYTDGFSITSLKGKTYTDSVDGSVQLAEPAHGSRTLEPAAVKALGLK